MSTKTKKKKEEEFTIDTVEIDKMIEKDKEITNKTIKPKRHIFIHFILILLLFTALLYFGNIIIRKEISIEELIKALLLTLFTIIFVGTSITYQRQSKKMLFLGSLLLFIYFGLNIYNNCTTNISVKTLENFSGKDLTYAMKWADKNNIEIKTEYEYSDMIDEYKVISQDIKSDTSLKNVKEITLSISEGPNPYKEIMIPSMIAWNSERVLKFIKENHLSNVEVEFVESEKAVNTVIEQNTSGNLKRDEKIILTFSYGEEKPKDEIKIIDLTNKTKFEAEFYLKQNLIDYEIEEDFSKSIKRGSVSKQSIKPGDIVKDEKLVITISKGPKIKIPEFKGMNLSKVTEWAIKNRVKLNFTHSYDDTIKENEIISCNYEKDEIIEQGSIIKIVLSKGALKMPKFNSLNDFYKWADKYNINYEEQHEFSNDIKAGEVISYSYKPGEKIKNNDTIIVKISDGEANKVPNLMGLTKKEAIKKLDKANLKYTFIYQNSSKEKDKVIAQSISVGSEISSKTTITVTLSNGKGNDKKTEERRTNTTNNNNSGSGSSNGNGNGNTNSNPSTPQQPTCNNVTVWIEGSHIKAGDASGTCSAIKNAYSSLNIKCSYVREGEYVGALVNGEAIDGKTFTTCDTVTLKIRSE